VRIKDNKGCSVVNYLPYYLKATEPVHGRLVEMVVYKEDLEGELDLKVVAELMKDLVYQNWS
jgi:hypothetical protein